MREITPDSPEVRRLKTTVKLTAYAIFMVGFVGLQAAKHFEAEKHSPPRPAHSKELR